MKSKKMKLVAIWVADYMSIKNQTFNFGSKYSYTVEAIEREANNISEVKLSVKNTSNYIDLFDGEDIINITGIIGVNGSGKTSLLKLLNVVEAKKPLMSPLILIFEDQETNSIRIIQYRNLGSLFNNKGLVKVVFDNTDKIIIDGQEDGSLDYSYNEDDIVPFSSTTIIFYSSLYSSQNDRFLSLTNPFNRSVDYQTRKSLEPNRIKEYIKQFEERVDERNILAEESFNILTLYHDERLERMIAFLADVNMKHEGIRSLIDKIHFPEFIQLWTYEDLPKKVLDFLSQPGVEFPRIKEIMIYCVENNKKETNASVSFKNELIYSSFLFILYNDYFRHNTNPKTVSLNHLHSFVESIELDENIFGNLLNYLTNDIIPQKGRMLEKIIDLLNNIDSLLSTAEITIVRSFFTKASYNFKISKNLFPLLKTFLSIKDLDSKSLIDFSLTPFSSGEDAILNQFSEFYIALCNEDLEDNIIVSIDEGELYLHPEWQRQYIDSLYNFFAYFNDKLSLNKKIQFIITSHSAFIVSDLPRHNLVFLEKDKLTGNCKISNPQSHSQTFGGNIHEMLIDAFFLKDGIIGAFAQKKINGVIREILSIEKIPQDRILYLKKVIEAIGEPVIRIKLLNMLSEKKLKDSL